MNPVAESRPVALWFWDKATKRANLLKLHKTINAWLTTYLLVRTAQLSEQPQSWAVQSCTTVDIWDICTVTSQGSRESPCSHNSLHKGREQLIKGQEIPADFSIKVPQTPVSRRKALCDSWQNETHDTKQQHFHWESTCY